jgi:hypothetical protein
LKPSNQYVAGFFDGEGSIGLYRSGSGSFILSVQTVQLQSKKSEKLFRFLKNKFGGKYKSIRKRGTRRPIYHHTLYGREAIEFLKQIRPYLILKANQADEAIRWYENRVIWKSQNKRTFLYYRSSADFVTARKLKALKRRAS